MNDRIGIFIGDVLGHGDAAALIASMLKSIFNISHQL
jgi:serine phosphatase RsbU (regulator of sigma subunit)